jgi:hypothetical protein
MDNNGSLTVNGTLTGNNTVGTNGLHCKGAVVINSGATVDFNTSTRLTMDTNSTLVVHDSSIWANRARGYLRVVDDCSGENPNYNNFFASFFIAPGSTITLTDRFRFSLHEGSGTTCSLQGAIDCNGNQAHVGAGSGQTFEIKSNSNILGSGFLVVRMHDNATFSDTHGNDYDFSGSITMVIDNSANMGKMYPFPIPNANYSISNVNSGDTVIAQAGTFKCKRLYINNDTYNLTWNASTNNPSYEIQGLDIYTTGTLTYNRGSGSITFVGSSGTDNIDVPTGTSLEDIILDCTGATKQIVNNFNSDSLSGSGGTLQSNSSGVQRTITVSTVGVCSNCSFKDISLSSANKVNAKDNCINLGNNKGFVFRDALLLKNVLL